MGWQLRCLGLGERGVLGRGLICDPSWGRADRQLSDGYFTTPRSRSAANRAIGEAATDGFAAVDALVALTILSSTIVFALAAAHQGLLAARAALEARQASDFLQLVMERSPNAPGITKGRSPNFEWQLTVEEPVLSAGAAALCAHHAVVTNLRSTRTYLASTAKVCPSGESP